MPDDKSLTVTITVCDENTKQQNWQRICLGFPVWRKKWMNRRWGPRRTIDCWKCKCLKEWRISIPNALSSLALLFPLNSASMYFLIKHSKKNDLRGKRQRGEEKKEESEVKWRSIESGLKSQVITSPWWRIWLGASEGFLLDRISPISISMVVPWQ